MFFSFLKKKTQKWSVKTRIYNPTGHLILLNQWRKILHNQSQAACKINLVQKTNRMAFIFHC